MRSPDSDKVYPVPPYVPATVNMGGMSLPEPPSAIRPSKANGERVERSTERERGPVERGQGAQTRMSQHVATKPKINEHGPVERERVERERGPIERKPSGQGAQASMSRQVATDPKNNSRPIDVGMYEPVAKQWVTSPDGQLTEIDAGHKYQHYFQHGPMAVGRIILEVNGIKPDSTPYNTSFTFTVMSGTIAAKVLDAAVQIFKTGGTFLIPQGVTYKLWNAGREPATILFTSLFIRDA
ncbi:hypothetical protein FB451DRAFT_1417919 [Mycena latifolia]|nr:hypothetical protein FB451DRAFT_1417919 [Mycena latifolia]